MKNKKGVSLLLACIMMLSVLSVSGFAFAVEDDISTIDVELSEIMSYAQYGNVNTTNVTLRSYWDRDGNNAIGQVAKNDSVEILGETGYDSYGAKWYKVKMRDGVWQGTEGYILCMYITLR